MKPYSIINFIAEKIPEYSWEKLRDMNTILLPVEGEGYVDENGLRQGLFARQHEKGSFKDDKKEDVWEYYYDNGNVRNRMTYKNGIANGEAIYYHNDGKLWMKGSWKNGREHGEILYYDMYGQVRTTEYWENGKFIN